MAFLRIAVFVALATWILDLVTKALPKGDWWVPHYTHRSLLLLPLMIVTVALVVAMCRTTATAVAGGLALGGYCANLIDLSINGMVWNMIPIPGTGGFTCNVADFAIVGGVFYLLPAVVVHTVRWTECRQNA